MEVHQTKKFLNSKGNHQEPMKWEKIFFVNDTSDSSLISKLHKEITKLSIFKNPVK